MEKLLVIEMAKKAKELIQKSPKVNLLSSDKLHPKHLVWMCEKIEEYGKNWSINKSHRWLGFIQCGMLANCMLDFQEIQMMFNKLKVDFGKYNEDQDLVDHLNMKHSFEFEIGGEG